MDFRLASNVYRKPWLIDRQAALAYLHALEEGKLKDVRGSWMEEDEEEKTIFQKLFANLNGVVTAPIHRADAIDHPGYEGSTVAILPVVGPLMKEDYCGWYGTAALKNELARINSSSTVKAIVMIADTPGGTVDGTQSFADAFRSSQKEKVTLVDGMICSAGYWVGSGADRIILTSRTDMVGCIGTMIGLYDFSKRYEMLGIVLREYTATASKDKNKDYKQAMKGDGALLIESTLDPMNDVFLEAVRTNRGEKLNQKKTLTGKTFIGQDAIDVGLADEISTTEQVIGNLIQKHSKDSKLKFYL